MVCGHRTAKAPGAGVAISPLRTTVQTTQLPSGVWLGDLALRQQLQHPGQTLPRVTASWERRTEARLVSITSPPGLATVHNPGTLCEAT